MKPATAKSNSEVVNRYDIATLRRELRPMRLLWYPVLGSTSDQAALLRRRGELFAPAAVLTGRQIKGRGRGSHTWWSGIGSITVTFALPIVPTLQPQHLPLLAGLAIRNELASLSEVESIQLKWPNDLLHRGKKLAGILCERIDGVDLIGLGLNVNDNPDTPAALTDRLTSLEAITGRVFDKTTVLSAIAGAIHRQIGHAAEHSFAAALREYEQHHALTGRRITVIDASLAKPISGACEGLDTTGRLLIRNRSGLQRIIAGQVQAY